MSSDFDELTVPYPAERDTIVEEERAGVLLVDQAALQAVAREDQQLRINRNLQRIERRPQEPAAAFERELRVLS